MLWDLGSVLMFMITSLLIIGFTLLLAKAVRRDNPTEEKLTTYECGEDPIGNPWIQFNIRFYVVALIFLIFEVEIVFLYPWATVFKEMGMFTFVEMMIFIGILLVGYAYAWVKGDLSWVLPKPKYTSDFDTSDIPRFKKPAVSKSRKLETVE
ncbi:MAG: NADH-quinone oxidoreductase subunit A [Candidatus Marinimicrobia bacterium]|nr:NADH-quinone oxidoreductase subunit A [Candidatus Neomarinimicrobiota bacterium]